LIFIIYLLLTFDVIVLEGKITRKKCHDSELPQATVARYWEILPVKIPTAGCSQPAVRSRWI
jgi:hypothetical protein